jgi:hypothetical protein
MAFTVLKVCNTSLSVKMYELRPTHKKPVTGSEASDMANTPNMKVDSERLWKSLAEYRAD